MNQKNPAIKRILADVKELHKHPSSRYSAAPLENNMFEWHFTIRGPADSAFEGGMYHGRILLPSEYPFKPPNIVFLTKNGRFEVGTKICLSISAYHEETWQPAWGVRTMLEAIISFLPSEGAGAIGALDWTKEERKKLAIESRSFCCSTCGPIAKLLSDPSTDNPEDTEPCSEIADQISQLKMSKLDRQTSDKVPGGSGGAFLEDITTTPSNALASTSLNEAVTQIDNGASIVDSCINGVALSPTVLFQDIDKTLQSAVDDKVTNFLMVESPKTSSDVLSSELIDISPDIKNDGTATESITSIKLGGGDEDVDMGLLTQLADLCVEDSSTPNVDDSLDILSPTSELRHRLHPYNPSSSVKSEVNDATPSNFRVNKIHNSDDSLVTSTVDLSSSVPSDAVSVDKTNNTAVAFNDEDTADPTAIPQSPQHNELTEQQLWTTFDDIINILLRLTGLAILVVLYRIVSRRFDTIDTEL